MTSILKKPEPPAAAAVAVTDGGGAARGGSSSNTTTAATIGSTKSAMPSTEKDKRRIALRSTNLEIKVSSSSSSSSNSSSLIKGPFDSNLKKNTAFVKRVRQNLGVESKDQFLREITSLGLDKYREEIIGALPEGMSRCANGKDVTACMEVSPVDRKLV